MTHPGRDEFLDVGLTGIHARLPGLKAGDRLDVWWDALVHGRVLTAPIDPEDHARHGVDLSALAHPDYVAVRGQVENSLRFDAELFRIAARDAELIDPQHRQMLESAWAALENSGQAPGEDGRRTAVFASSSQSRYVQRIISHSADEEFLARVESTSAPDFAATRISYSLGLTGPAMTVQTACSSSLVAVHLALQALNSGDCDRALVVAACIGFPQGGHRWVRGGIMSRDGRCRPLDAGATGTVGGSAVVAVVLERMSDIQPGRQVHAVLLGSALNNDGRAKFGFSAPSPRGQTEVMLAAYGAAEVSGDSLGYLELHGTGTLVGDPIEWASTSAALTALGASPSSIPVGAVKANVGHTDVAAGLVGLIKASLVVRHGVVPPVANFERPNTMLSSNSPLSIPAQATDWYVDGPRRAGVSSFGIGGTNAHVVLQEPPSVIERPSVPSPRLIVLSAQSREALSAMVVRTERDLSEGSLSIDDVAHTLVAGRNVGPHRAAATASDATMAADALRRQSALAVGMASDDPPGVVFLLPGQGSQRPGMAEPFRVLPGFEAHLDDTLSALPSSCVDEVRASLSRVDFPAAALQETRLAQPALFCLERAAALALIDSGVRPAALLGHSLGEVTAVHLSGAVDLRVAAEFVIARGESMQGCERGAMLELSCDEHTAHELLHDCSADEVDVAVVNGPHACVVAGPLSQIDILEKECYGRVRVRRLRTSHSFHSGAMQPAADALEVAFRDIPCSAVTVPYLSNHDGRWVEAGSRPSLVELAANVRRSVALKNAVRTVAEVLPSCVAVEVGPGRSLTATALTGGLDALPLTATGDGDALSVLAGLGQLWVKGVPVDLRRLTPPGDLVHVAGTTFAGREYVAPEAGVAPRRDLPVQPTPALAVPAPASDPATCLDPESVVRSAWSDVLGGEPQDLTEFITSGADSLAAIRVAQRIQDNLGVSVEIRDLLTARTFADHVQLVRLAAARTTCGRGAIRYAPDQE